MVLHHFRFSVYHGLCALRRVNVTVFFFKKRVGSFVIGAAFIDSVAIFTEMDEPNFDLLLWLVVSCVRIV